jgi:hypothetical protein
MNYEFLFSKYIYVHEISFEILSTNIGFDFSFFAVIGLGEKDHESFVEVALEPF